MKKLAIIGNGIGAVTAIKEIRKHTQDISIDVFTDERHPYYPRPKLMEVVAGSINRDDIIQYSHDWYEKMGVDLRLGERVVSIAPDDGILTTTEGVSEGYDGFLMATGSHPFVPPIRGAEKYGVHVLRTLDDALDIRDGARDGSTVLVIGGGILGVEIAAAVKRRGAQPVVITNTALLLSAQLDPEASDILSSELVRMGIEVKTEFVCSEISGDERVSGVVSKEGDSIDGDMVVIATGVRANTALAKDCGLTCNRGIIVDDHMRTTHPRIYAAGDCIEWAERTGGIIPIALDTARIAARNIVEEGTATYSGTVPSNTLKVAGMDLTSIGLFGGDAPNTETVTSSDMDRCIYRKIVIRDGVVVGGIALGDRRFAIRLRKMVTDHLSAPENRETLFD